MSGFVAASGLPRRDVESVLRELAPFVKTDGDRYHLPDLGRLDRRSFVTDVHDERTQDAPLDENGLVDRMSELAAALPPARWRLDHVPATAETMARRALYLASEYELGGASVLSLGDHDLTSLAVGSAEPEADLTVVDIDEPLLDYVVGSADGLGFPLTAAWADLRLAFPPSLVASADLVFTDPPYTTEGMRLFLTRALEALRSTGHERLAFCFGTGERHLVKGLEVQSLLGDLRLALEAMLPGFNHYDGAEAIGGRSDLYICRPTKGAIVGEPAHHAARSARSRRSARSKASTARIYTRGPSAEEAPARLLPDGVAAAALAAAGDGPLLLVGEGWGNEAIGLPEYFQRITTWATAARPGPFPFTGTPVINTYPDHRGAAVRTVIVTASERAVVVAARSDLGDMKYLDAAYTITPVPTGPGGEPAVVDITRHDRPPGDTAEAVLRHILLHPGAKVVNAWRDGLIAVAREAGTTMTKNEARTRIGADALPPALRRLRSWELPLSLLRTLAREVARSTG